MPSEYDHAIYITPFNPQCFKHNSAECGRGRNCGYGRGRQLHPNNSRNLYFQQGITSSTSRPSSDVGPYTPSFSQKCILGPSPNVTCQLCNRVGHTCAHRFDHAFAGWTLPSSFSALLVGESIDQ